MSVLTTRPDTTGAVGGVTIVGDTTVHGALNDETDDSYIACGHDQHPFLQFNEPTVPAGTKVKAGRLRARARRLGGNAVVFNWHMRDPNSGANINGSVNNMPVPSLSTTTFVALRDEDTTPHVAPTAIFVDFYIHGAQATSKVHLYALYFDTIYVTKPVVTVTQPTGTIAFETTPTVVWQTGLDSDGGLQTHFELKFFTSAQYGAGGFDPNTTTSTNESGIVESGDDSWAQAEALADGTWRAYMRIAQTVNGEIFWGDWAFSQFTLATDRPGLPTFTLTSEPTLGRIKVLLTAVAGDATTTQFQTQVADDTPGEKNWMDIYTSDGGGRSTPSGGTSTVYDYEAPNGGTRLYRTRAIHAYPEGDTTSAWTATLTSSWTSLVWWVKSLVNPSLNMFFAKEDMKSQPSASRPGRLGLFQPLGAKYPIAVMDKRSSPSGEMVFLPTSDDIRDDLEALLDEVGVVLIQAPPGVNDWPDRYCVIRDYERERAIDSPFVDYSYDSVQWTEVARP